MRLRGVWRLSALVLVLGLAAPASATNVQDIANNVSLDSYTAYLDNHLYTHNGDSRGFDVSGSPRYPAGDHDSARDYIYSQFASFGLTTTLDPFSFTSGGHTYLGASNVIGVKTGKTRPGDIYILGAHYDSVQNPGADDNASGVAGVLEAARVLSQYQFGATLVFAAFDGEEKWMCGSTHYAADAAGQNILGMVSLDMLAYNPAGAHHDKAYIYGRDASNTIKQALASAMTTYSGGITPEVGGDTPYSDHAPFEAQGWQACLLIEHAVWNNPNYHTQADSADTVGYLDYAYATGMTRSAVAYAAGAAGIVPEPATLLMLTVGALALAARGRRGRMSPSRLR